MDERTEAFIKQYADDFYVPKVSLELIPINELVCDQKYQRELSQKQVKKIVKNFTPYQINPVKVSRRDGKNYVINGQHTMEIIAQISESHETPVWCMIYDEMDYTTEATVFAEQMKYVRALTPYEVFIAKLEAGNQDSLMIKAIVEQYHLVIGKESQDGMICAIKALEDIYDKLGIDILSRTIRVNVNTWGGNVKSLSGNMLKGLAILLATYDDGIKDDVFIDKLGAMSLKELIRTGNERKRGPFGFAEAMYLDYTYKCRTTLSMEPLYKFKFKRKKSKETVIAEGLEKIEKYKEESQAINEILNQEDIEVAYDTGIYDSILMESDDGGDGD